MSNPFHLGHLIEGAVERDPVTDRWRIRTSPSETFDVQDALSKFEGKDVRFTLISFDQLAKLAALVESQGGGGMVAGVFPEDLKAPLNVRRKP